MGRRRAALLGVILGLVPDICYLRPICNNCRCSGQARAWRS